MESRVAVRGIFVHNGKLLCAKLKPYRTRSQGAFWCTIGGGVDEGETITDAIEREILEETGIKPVVGKLMFVHQYVWEDVHSIEFLFWIANASDYQNIDLTATTHGQAEIAEIAFIDPKEAYVLPRFLSEVDLSEASIGDGVRFFSYM